DDEERGGALAERGGAEGAGADGEVDDRHGQHDADVAADDEHSQPDRNAVDQADVRQRQHDEGRHQQQLVGGRVEPGAEIGLLAGGAGNQAVERVGDPGGGEDDEGPAEEAVHDQQHERRDQQHSQQRELVGDGENRRGHGSASASRRPTISTASAPVTG